MKKIIFLSGLFFIITGLWLARVEIIQRITPALAAGHGLRINALDINRIGLNKAEVRHIHLAHADDHARISVAADDIAIDLDVSVRSAPGIAAIAIDRAAVEIRLSRAERATASVTAATTALRDYIQRLPLYGIDIRRLEVRYYHDAELLGEYTGKMKYKHGIYLDGSLDYRGHAGRIGLSLDGSGVEALINGPHDDNAFIRIKGEHRIEHDRLLLKLDADYDLNELGRFAAAESDLSAERARGRIAAVAELNLARGLDALAAEFTADVAFDFSIYFSSLNYDVKKGRLDVRAKCALAPQGIKSCRLDRPQRLAVRLTATPLFIQEYFNGPPQGYTIDLRPDEALTLRPQAGVNNGWIITGDGRLSAYPDAAQFRVVTEFSGLDFQLGEEAWSLSGDYHLRVDGGSGARPFKRGQVKFQGRGNLSVNPDRAAINIDSGARLALSEVEYAEISFAMLELRQDSQTRAVYRFRDNALKIEGQRFSLTTKGAGYADMSFGLEAAALNLTEYGVSENNPFMHAELSIAGISALKNGIKIKGSECLMTIDLDHDHLSMNGDLRLGAEKTPFRFLLSSNLSAGNGLLQFESSPIPLANNATVARIISVSGFPLQLKDGSFGLSGEVNWDDDYQALRMALQLSAIKVSGDYAQNPFVNLNLGISFEKDNGWLLSAPASLTLDTLNVGLPLNDISLRVEEYQHNMGARPVIKLADFKANILDGSVFSEKIEVDLNKPVNQFSLTLSDLSLASILALNRNEALQATGMINGELPLSLNEGVLQIEDGWLEADQRGGVIRYDGIGEALSGNADLRLVAGLLKYFQYNELSARVNLNPAGALTLRTKLYGRGPEAGLDAAVNLNFNIDLDLWKFLESARLLTRIAEDISDRAGVPANESDG